MLTNNTFLPLLSLAKKSTKSTRRLYSSDFSLSLLSPMW